MIIVLYDDLCPLCRKEISFYKTKVHADKISWVKISQESNLEARYDISKRDALMYLHVRDCNNQWHKGVSAFIIIWSEIKYFRLLAKFVGFPIIRQITGALYWIFAQWRFRRLKHCQDCRLR